MRVPLEWLKEHVTIRLSPEALAERLTMAGLEVVGIERVDGVPVLDLDITPNRADCLSLIGVAREVAAITGQRLALPQGAGGGRRGAREGKNPRPTPHGPCPMIRIEDRKACQRYIGRLFDGVTIAPSPKWMQRRLVACGARPINNIVDITNYVLLERGQPLHAFDFERLVDGAIIVRRARAGELITTLDGINRTLSAETLVIADGKQAVAVAGVMGGTGSEVTFRTRQVLLESALFDPVTIRRATRRLGLASESSYRFERGVDPDGVEAASARAAGLICQFAGAREVVRSEVGEAKPRRTVITLELSRVDQWLGTAIAPTTVRTGLARLSCHVASSGAGRALRVTIPPFRRDLTQEVDLYEEIARLVGYERLPARLPAAACLPGKSDNTTPYARTQALKALCVNTGLTEVINWSLVSEADLVHCGYNASEAARLTNPLSQDHAYLRPSLLIGLLQVVRRNLTQGAIGVRLFEVGRVVQPQERTERLRLGIALAGMWSGDWQTTLSCDFFRLKGLIGVLTGRLCGVSPHYSQANPPWAQPGHAARLTLQGRVLGVAGRLATAIAKALDLEQDVWLAELAIDELLVSSRVVSTVNAPSTFPPVKRDLSIIVDARAAFAEIERTIRESGGPLASRVELIDRYTGKPIPAGKQGLTFTIEYRDSARTLTAAEAEAVHQRISHTLASRFGATLR